MKLVRHIAIWFGAIWIASLLAITRAHAWDSATHRAIARLAVAALPPSPLKSTLFRNQAALEEYAVEPDTVLKEKYGKAEARHHYIDIEWFGAEPWSALDPDLKTMQQRFGEHTLERAGTLPWTIAEVSDQLHSEWQRGDCATVIRLSGYLAHYVGDASQPLHSTINYDGYARDRGIHARIESAVDHSLRELEPIASREVHLRDINDVWTPTIAEIRDANGLIGQVIRADRSARETGDDRDRDYRRRVMNVDAAMFARQIARAASVLGSIWLYEWHHANSPASCVSEP